MLKRVDGDLLKLAEEGRFSHIVHGCNCFCTMGSGIARQIADKYPEAKQIDAMTISGDRTKLGLCTEVFIPTENGGFKIINAYTQYKFGQNQVNFDAVALKSVLDGLLMTYPNAKYGFPYIGMGLGGGDPNIIIPMLETFAKKVVHNGGEVTLVKYEV